MADNPGVYSKLFVFSIYDLDLEFCLDFLHEARYFVSANK